MDLVERYLFLYFIGKKNSVILVHLTKRQGLESSEYSLAAMRQINVY